MASDTGNQTAGGNTDVVTDFTHPDLSMRESADADENFSYDLSTAEEGYITVDPMDDGYAVTVSTEGAEYVYLDLPRGISVIPLSAGNAEYNVSFARRIDAEDFRFLASDISLSPGSINMERLFTMPNYMVDFSDESSFILQAAELARSEDREAAADRICDWVYRNIDYDKARGDRIIRENITLSRNIPDLEMVYRQKQGICLDKAALAAAMMRSQGIPAKLCFGTCGSKFHAWLLVKTSGKWTVMDPTTGNTETFDYYPVYFY